MEVLMELKYKFETDPFEMREYAVRFDLTNRALGGPEVSTVGRYDYLIN